MKMRRIENALEGITLQIEKKEESAGALNAYIYLIMDDQLNIQNGEYIPAVYPHNHAIGSYWENQQETLVKLPVPLVKSFIGNHWLSLGGKFTNDKDW